MIFSVVLEIKQITQWPEKKNVFVADFFQLNLFLTPFRSGYFLHFKCPGF